MAKPVSRVLLVGMDGLEWSVVLHLLAQGRMPNLLALMQRGSYGYLASMKPTLSPVVWTTIATGKLMEDHKVTNFLDPQRRVFTSGRRAVSAVWNIADHYGLSTNLFGWFVTWPAEHVRGMVVSGSSADSQLDANWKPALLPGVAGQVWPEALTDEVLALAAQAGAMDKVQQLAGEKIFPGVQQELMNPLQKKVLQQTLWSLLSDETYFEIACKYIKEHPADLNLVYFGGTDVVGHRYWREFRPKGYAYHDGEVLDEELAEVIPNYYDWMDEMLGALVAAAGPDTTVLVVSDHGMHAIAQEKEDTQFGMTGHHLDAPPGVIVAAGPGILKQGGVKAFLENGALPTHGSVVDVTPTLLALLGIPVGKDMRGRAVLTLLEPGPARDNAKLPPVPSHDEGFRAPVMDDVPAQMSNNFEQHFQALGYLQLAPHEGVSEIVQPPPAAPSPPATDPH
ncbi:MAG TPA: alkaline phosphatase family protein [Planctomycetota bacterium]|nr:alkaline phosphatase family protein [Planctomycetota bacterium]